jgi:hypothetical protein
MEHLMMGWWTRRSDRDENDRSLAGWLLDDALCVFGALHAAAADDDPRVDVELRDLLRTTAAGRPRRRDPSGLPRRRRRRQRPPAAAAAATPAHDAAHDADGPADGPSVVRAVQALSDYAERLAEVALVSCYRQDDASMVFSELAADAEARMETLAA